MGSRALLLLPVGHLANLLIQCGWLMSQPDDDLAQLQNLIPQQLDSLARWEVTLLWRVQVMWFSFHTVFQLGL